MAGELNGARSGAGSGTRHVGALRVSYVPGTQPEKAAAATAVVEVGVAGDVVVDGARRAAALADVQLPRARLVLAPGGEQREEHRVLVMERPDPTSAAAGVRPLEVVVDGWRFELDVESEARARLRDRATSAGAGATKGGPAELRAIIPGRVLSVDVAEGDLVEPGRRLLVLEAMKMQNELKAPRAGTVRRVAVGPGQTVELGDVLLVIE